MDCLEPLSKSDGNRAHKLVVAAPPGRGGHEAARGFGTAADRLRHLQKVREVLEVHLERFFLANVGNSLSVAKVEVVHAADPVPGHDAEGVDPL